MILLDKKPFSKKIKLSNENLNSLLTILPKLKINKNSKSTELKNEEKYNQLILENWKYGVYSLSKNELDSLIHN